MEVSFSKEIELLRKKQGEQFHGEGILAITKALLQSGVAYIGGYQGAPVSHLLDVMVQAKGYMDELGVHVEACSNEASAAAMLGPAMEKVSARIAVSEHARRTLVQHQGGEPVIIPNGIYVDRFAVPRRLAALTPPLTAEIFV